MTKFKQSGCLEGILSLSATLSIIYLFFINWIVTVLLFGFSIFIANLITTKITNIPVSELQNNKNATNLNTKLASVLIVVSTIFVRLGYSSLISSNNLNSISFFIDSLIMNPAELQKNKLVKTKICPKCNLKNASLAGIDITGANLNGADLSKANLNGADLNGANLKYANLSNANLSNANLNGANLKYANLSNANLNGANLSNVNLDFVNLEQTKINSKTIINTKWRVAWQIINQGATYRNLRNVDLSKVNLYDSELEGADLRNANLSKTNLNGANLKYANLSYANLKGATLSSSTLFNASLFAANLEGAGIIEVDLRNANFRNANLINARLEFNGFTASGANFCGSIMPDGTVWNGSTGRRVDCQL